MKQKLMSNKKIIICACAAAVAVVVGAIALLAGTKKEEAFRSILVYDVEGSAVIERETVGVMEAAENLYLESGDRVSVAADSGMRMKLDDDKYVMAEAETVFSVEAEGTEADSKTRICLEQGAITNEIQHPLSAGSQYETSTPNSVMAVRGTIYRAAIYTDENGEQNTKVCCFQGQVGAKPILPDGTYGEEVLVPAGSELTVYQDGTTSGVGDIAYDGLPRQAIVNLLGMMENGQEMAGISKADLTQLTLETEDVSETAESEQPKESETVQPETEEPAVESAEEQEETQMRSASNQAKKGAAKERKQQAAAPAAEQKPSKTEAPKGNTGNNSDSEDHGANDGGSGQSKPKEPDKPKKPAVYTVTFQYQDKVFATQKVERGKTASKPVLVPEADGAWDFDFDKKIEKNTTISWEKAD